MSRVEWIEGLVMLLCIPLLWPVVRWMRSGEPLSQYYMIVLAVAAALLLTITVRRIRRLRSAFREQRRQGPGRSSF